MEMQLLMECMRHSLWLVSAAPCLDVTDNWHLLKKQVLEAAVAARQEARVC